MHANTDGIKKQLLIFCKCRFTRKVQFSLRNDEILLPVVT